ncbi:MAG TPA: hypothetical protein VF618_20965 [Thermoanaerobaculia bacterium]
MMLSVVLLLSLSSAAAAACIPTGSVSAIQTELSAGRDAVLCANATFNVTSTINFVYANTKIYTEGYPTGATRATLRVASSSLQTLVNGVDKSGVAIRNVILDGARPTYGYVRPAAEALIKLGGNASGQTVDSIEAFEPRGWTALHVFEGSPSWNGSAWTGGCTSATVTNSFIHDAGEILNSKWADGISMACRNSYVAYNTIEDATDGGIVVFGAPGTIVEWNTVKNVDRTAIGGINMVDTTYRRSVLINGVATTVGDYTGTIVRYNTLVADAPWCGFFCFPVLMYSGISMGPRVWWCSPPDGVTIAYGGKAIGNELQGNAMWYGMPADGVASWESTSNINNAGFLEDFAGSSCSSSNLRKAFVRHSTHATGTFQSQYVEGQTHVVMP